MKNLICAFTFLFLSMASAENFDLRQDAYNLRLFLLYFSPWTLPKNYTQETLKDENFNVAFAKVLRRTQLAAVGAPFESYQIFKDKKLIGYAVYVRDESRSDLYETPCGWAYFLDIYMNVVENTSYLFAYSYCPD